VQEGQAEIISSRGKAMGPSKRPAPFNSTGGRTAGSEEKRKGPENLFMLGESSGKVDVSGKRRKYCYV